MRAVCRNSIFGNRGARGRVPAGRKTGNSPRRCCPEEGPAGRGRQSRRKPLFVSSSDWKFSNGRRPLFWRWSRQNSARRSSSLSRAAKSWSSQGTLRSREYCRRWWPCFIKVLMAGGQQRNGGRGENAVDRITFGVKLLQVGQGLFDGSDAAGSRSCLGQAVVAQNQLETVFLKKQNMFLFQQ